MKRKIVDCVTFYKELDMLEFRLMEHYDYFDYFVIVEAAWLHKTGETRELLFEKNKERYAKYIDKIIYVPVYDCPSLEDLEKIAYYHSHTIKSQWGREHFHRRQIMRGLLQLMDQGKIAEHDLILVSDVDEIFDITLLDALQELDWGNLLVIFSQDLYHFSLNGFRNDQWRAVGMITYEMFIKINTMVPYCFRIFLHRDGGNKEVKRLLFPQQAGWHFSYFGDCQRIREKHQSNVLEHFEGHKMPDTAYLHKHLNEFAEKSVALQSYLPKNYEYWIPQMYALIESAKKGCPSDQE